MSEIITRPEANPVSLIEKALASGADIETLERLMSLQERWEAKESVKAFNISMSRFQANKPEVKTSKSVSYKGEKAYEYAPLSSIQKAIDPVLTSCGLSYSWKQSEQDKRITITCIVGHIEGHKEETTLSSAPDPSGGKNSIQSIGSAVTYLKRYTLMNAFGLSVETDDDGILSDKKEVDPEIVAEIQDKVSKQKTQPELNEYYKTLEDFYAKNSDILKLFKTRKNELNKKN